MVSKVAEFYDSLAREHGASYQASAASSQEALEARWKVLDAVLPGIRGLWPCSVLDVGCGTGGLATLALGLDYVGIDLSREAIEAATARADVGFRVRFVHCDLFDWDEPADIVLSQGPFFTLPLDGKSWEDAKAMIEKMWSLTKEVLAFTAIIKWPGEEFEGWELRLDPMETIAFLRTLSPAVEFKTGYWPGDGLFVVRRHR